MVAVVETEHLNFYQNQYQNITKNGGWNLRLPMKWWRAQLTPQTDWHSHTVSEKTYRPAARLHCWTCAKSLETTNQLFSGKNKSNKLVLTSLVYHVVLFTMGNDAKTHPHSNTRTICGLLGQHTRHLRHWQDWGDFVAFNSALTYQFEPSPQSAYTHLQKTQSGHSLHLFPHTILKVLPLTWVKTV